MSVKLKQIIDLVKADTELSEDVIISGACKIDDGSEGRISFLANPKYEKYIYESNASAVLVPTDFNPRKKYKTRLLKVNDVLFALSQVLELFDQKSNQHYGISPQALVHPEAQVSERAYVGPFCIIAEGAIVKDHVRIQSQVYIGRNVEIGVNSMIYAGVKVFDNCKIGSFCTLHPNAVIGSEGFGFSQNKEGQYKKIPQIGNVILEDQVEIGANTTIDRATFASTIIKKGSKLDNLVQIGHNVVVGKNTAIAAQTGISGSSVIGDHCRIGGQVGITGHIKIADKTQIQAKSGVGGNVFKEATKLYGYPAIDYNSYLRAYAAFKQMPEYLAKIRSLEKRIQYLEKEKKGKNFED